MNNHNYSNLVHTLHITTAHIHRFPSTLPGQKINSGGERDDDQRDFSLPTEWFILCQGENR